MTNHPNNYSNIYDPIDHHSMSRILMLPIGSCTDSYIHTCNSYIIPVGLIPNVSVR